MLVVSLRLPKVVSICAERSEVSCFWYKLVSRRLSMVVSMCWWSAEGCPRESVFVLSEARSAALIIRRSAEGWPGPSWVKEQVHRAKRVCALSKVSKYTERSEVCWAGWIILGEGVNLLGFLLLPSFITGVVFGYF